MNYGKDVNQTQPVEREYLEGIYNEIGVSPLRTEPDNLSGVITNEMWMREQAEDFMAYAKDRALPRGGGREKGGGGGGGGEEAIESTPVPSRPTQVSLFQSSSV